MKYIIFHVCTVYNIGDFRDDYFLLKKSIRKKRFLLNFVESWMSEGQWNHDYWLLYYIFLNFEYFFSKNFPHAISNIQFDNESFTWSCVCGCSAKKYYKFLLCNWIKWCLRFCHILDPDLSPFLYPLHYSVEDFPTDHKSVM